MRNITLALGIALLTLVHLSIESAAQDFTSLHIFVGSDGANPTGTLIGVSNRLYGTTSEFWGAKNGTVFGMNMDGSDFLTLHHFSPSTYDPDSGQNTNSDGSTPMAGLVFSGNRLYGTTHNGGSFGLGTVFAVNIDGTGFTNLHSFNGSDGAQPCAPLTLSADTLYGAAYQGGEWPAGTLFSIKTNGAAFTVLHQFNYDDGDGPMSGLTLAVSTLYGTAHFGGAFNAGVVFKINTDGTGFTNLHVFNNSDGRGPANGKLTLSGSTLYGTTYFGGNTSSAGNAGSGTVFKLETDGSGFSTLHNFSALVGSTNADGAFPATGAVLDSNTLYGSASGGIWGSGTVFSLGADGTRFTMLHNFTALSPPPEPYTNTDGAGLQGDLLLTGNRLYGTTVGGAAGYGTIFSISLPVFLQLSLSAAAENLIFVWPTNAVGFTLQTSTDPSSTALWSNVSQGPRIVNGQNTITLPRDTNMIGQSRFYRLIR
jgi:uncharacterized repeat protein (TIGR03803 family)